MRTEDQATLDFLDGLELEEGGLWGDTALRFQWEDAEQIVCRYRPRVMLLRGRGLSKTTDVAGIALALLATQAPRRSASYIVASDAEQAGLFLDAISGFVDRSPELHRAVTVQANRVVVKDTLATLTVLSSDARSAFGRRAWLFIVDELGEWPNSKNHRRLWTSIISGLAKRKDYRFTVMTTASEPDSIAAEKWKMAQTSPLWYTARHPGPPPWWDEQEVTEGRAEMTAADVARYWDCEFVEGDDALVTAEDIARAVRDAPPARGAGHVMALDVGTRRDYTALVVAHRTMDDRYEVDRVAYWKPPRLGKVDLADVEATALRWSREFGATVHFDRMQAEQMMQNLERAGVTTKEFVFSTAGVNRIARRLATVFSQGRVGIPAEEETIREFQSVRLVSTGPGTVKLHNPGRSHDDVVTAIGIAVAVLSDQPPMEGAMIARMPDRALPTILGRTGVLSGVLTTERERQSLGRGHTPSWRR